MKVEEKRAQEKEILSKMVKIYCKGQHQGKKELCKDCQELLDYALLRTEKCPFMETKTFCSACKVHCYGQKSQEEIRQVMKYAGPRMLLYHPVAAINHGRITLYSKWLNKKK